MQKLQFNTKKTEIGLRIGIGIANCKMELRIGLGFANCKMELRIAKCKLELELWIGIEIEIPNWNFQIFSFKFFSNFKSTKNFIQKSQKYKKIFLKIYKKFSIFFHFLLIKKKIFNFLPFFRRHFFLRQNFLHFFLHFQNFPPFSLRNWKFRRKNFSNSPKFRWRFGQRTECKAKEFLFVYLLKMRIKVFQNFQNFYQLLIFQLLHLANQTAMS